MRLAIDLDVEFEPRHGLVEKPVPGRGADNRLVMKKFFELIGKLVRPHGAKGVEPGLEAGERRALRQFRR